MLARSRWDDNSDKTKAGNIRNVVRSQTDVSKRRKKKKKNKTKGPWHGNRYLSKPTPTIRQVRQFLLFPLSIKLFYSAIFFFREKNKKQEIKKADLVCKPFPSHCCPHFLSIKLFYWAIFFFFCKKKLKKETKKADLVCKPFSTADRQSDTSSADRHHQHVW